MGRRARKRGGLAAEVAAKLITLRRRRGFDTAKEAAEFLGMAQVTYCRFEAGTRVLDLETLDAILARFDATLLELLGLPEGRPNPRGGARDR